MRSICYRNYQIAKLQRCLVSKRDVVLQQQQHQLQNRQMASSVFADFSNSMVRRAVKSTLFKHDDDDDNAIDDEIWPKNQRQQEQSINGSNMIEDRLDDLYLQQSTRYWPHVPCSTATTTNNINNNSHTSGIPTADPFKLAKAELDTLSTTIRQDLIGTDHPVLNQAAAYFFDDKKETGKKVRPMMVMLLSRALANSFDHELEPEQRQQQQFYHSTSPLFSPPLSWQRADLPQAQRRLAEITEMIHTASLFHDDVIDGSDTRRGMPAVHSVYGNKVAILAGDYLLARASIHLARLHNTLVVECMSTTIDHLVRGEVMQLRGTNRIQYYLRKNYYKTASLMAHSCQSAAVLGNYPDNMVRAAYKYGKHVGMAFQLMDDVLDFQGSLQSLGKPALADLKAGLSTAPVLFAAEEFDELEPLMQRKFAQEGDVERAVELVFASTGMQRTVELARVHAEQAMDALLENVQPSLHCDALIQLAQHVIARSK